MHRRCTEDAQIVLFEYDVGITQTHTIYNKIRKAEGAGDKLLKNDWEKSF